MSEFITVARPTPKRHGLCRRTQNVERWQDMLAFAAEDNKTNKWQSFSLARLRETLARVVYLQFVVSNWTKTVRT